MLTIKNYYEDTRKEFYARKSGVTQAGKAVSAAPPVVESASATGGQSFTPKYSYEDLRNAVKPNDKAAIIAELMRNR